MSKFELLKDCRVRRDVSSNQLTTFGVGKGVSLLVEPETVESLLTVLKDLDDKPLFLGNGSNLILPDSWITRPVIRLPKTLSGPVPKDSLLAEALLNFRGQSFYAGTSLINLSRTFSNAGMSGLEFAAGIPGTLGGGVKMNAGAHGESISSVISGVIVSDSTGNLRSLSREQLEFSYRHSVIKDSVIKDSVIKDSSIKDGALSNGLLVLAASIELQSGEREQIRARRQSCLEYRTKTQPLKMPSAGSVFRNPVDSLNPVAAAAVYLEQVGLKGYQHQGVGYSDMHSNWLVRLDDFARAQAVVELIELGKKRVFENCGLNLTPEILLW